MADGVDCTVQSTRFSMTPSDTEAECTDCRTRIVQAAREVFVEEGYRASIDTVAARAGVARQTLYNHFESKADLFAEVIRQITKHMLISLEGDDHDLRDRLRRFGTAYRYRVLNQDGLGLFRILVAESQRFPELVGTAYRNGPLLTKERVREVLDHAISQGQMRTCDPEFAATMLLSMLVGADRSHYLFSGELVPEHDPLLIDQIIDTFLRAFGPATQPVSTQ